MLSIDDNHTDTKNCTLTTFHLLLFVIVIGNRKRFMWNNGHLLIWNYVSDMFYSDLEHGLQLLPKITADHINLTSYSIMRVNLAAQVLSSSMASMLKEFGPPEAVGTAEFCQKMDTFFECFNVRSMTEGERSRKAFLLPYKDVNDPRFSWLTDDFLDYLRTWCDSVIKRHGSYDADAQARMFISHQTYLETYSLIELVKFLLNADVDFVLTNRFCQDPVKQYFGKQREFGRRSDNPIIKTFGYNDNSIRMQRSNVQI